MKNKATPIDIETLVDESLLVFIASDDVQDTLQGVRRGIEREMLRVTPSAQLSHRPHPKSLGSALTHPYITTDFSEAQLELVTPAVTGRKETFKKLASLHHFVATHLPEGESMWAASMPPSLPLDSDIAIANYGTSNVGMAKMRYREGLANRYGKRMQLISGIHYNFSLPKPFWQMLHANTESQLPLEDFISERYFHLIRNVLRNGWIIPYLFGASPAADKSYLRDKPYQLLQLDSTTDYLPWATSLRLSNLGYGSSEQSRFPISFNSKQDYLIGLCKALTQPSVQYSYLAEHQQLNGSVLQLENELYGSIRPKIVNAQMRPLVAMCHYGVEYIELRSLDNNPLLPLGIDELQSQFIDLFLLYSALSPSPEISKQERTLIMQRQELVATQGRKPNLMLPTLNGEVLLTDLAKPLMNLLAKMATIMDGGQNTNGYEKAVMREQAKFDTSQLTPSAQILSVMEQENLNFTTLMKSYSDEHQQGYLSDTLSDDEMTQLQMLAYNSLLEQKQLEAGNEENFDEYLAQKRHINCEMPSRADAALSMQRYSMQFQDNKEPANQL
ncbi:glutamate--cysteine ligase [Photobacterium sp. GB-72]|uniref:glutamate--cysteine ligase n=1 Tax=Photobacterium sp. GB-72 TaxID=2022105 RepID=UPI000D170AD2|nr:glutamate--cysteine ligase [Photobacterium sp. GB-72]PSV31921.1 glutamate--cysteine ligase [Photobacterium sp. GB-72]